MCELYPLAWQAGWAPAVAVLAPLAQYTAATQPPPTALLCHPTVAGPRR